jgi:hypothetical protein
MSNHDEIISGALASVSLFIVSIFPTVAEFAKGLDVYLVVLMHLLQTIAAFAAIVVAYFTINKMISEKRNKTFK